KTFLQHILGLSCIVHDFQGERVETPGETIVEMREGPFIALCDSREQFDLEPAFGVIRLAHAHALPGIQREATMKAGSEFTACLDSEVNGTLASGEHAT